MRTMHGRKLLFTLLIFVTILYFVVSSLFPNSNRLTLYRHTSTPALSDVNNSRLHGESQTQYNMFRYVDFNNKSSSASGQFRVPEPMLISLNYWEQFANAMASLGDLQCWATTVGITKVMEPFIWTLSASTFHFLPSRGSAPGPLIRSTLSDLIDIDAWNKMSTKYSLSTLVPIETFLDYAIRKVVYVQIIFPAKILPQHCQSMEDILKTQWYKYLTHNGFHISDTVCIKLEKETNYTLTPKSFQDKIFTKSGYNVSLVFNIWTGIRQRGCDTRLCLKDSYCNDVRSATHLKFLRPSVLTDGPGMMMNQYIHKDIMFTPPSQRVANTVHHFMSDFMSGAEYVTVMIRSEKLIGLSPQAWKKCMATTISDWKSVLANGTNLKTLFFTDASAHGSATLASNKKAVSFSKELEKSLLLEHHPSELNQYLERTSGSKNSVFISTLEREIVAHAKCVIMIGAGTFQRMTLHMYAYYHRREKLCYSFRDKTCQPLVLDTG